MTLNTAELAGSWDRSGFRTIGGVTFNELHKKIEYFERTHYHQYIPTCGVNHADYEARIQAWIASVPSEEDRRTLFEFAAEITFFAREDFEKLYESAMSGPISRWLIDTTGIAFNDDKLTEKVLSAAHAGTWYCPMSDSMPIADFHHANGLGGIRLRPDWRSLIALGELNRVNDFMMTTTPKITRVVVLEDFIGAGWQIREKVGNIKTSGGTESHDIVSFASLMPSVSFLFVPLIVCPDGATVLRAMADPLPNVQVAPVLELSNAELISPKHVPDPATIHGKIYDLASRLYPLVKGSGTSRRPYTAYGNGETGARLVMYSNTPAGTLPIIHHTSDTWSPPFPRSARVR